MEIEYNFLSIINNIFGREAANKYVEACRASDKQLIHAMECCAIGYQCGISLQHHDEEDGPLNVTGQFKRAIRIKP